MRFRACLLARGRGVYVWMSLQEIAILFRYLALVIQTLGVSGVSAKQCDGSRKTAAHDCGGVSRLFSRLLTVTFVKAPETRLAVLGLTWMTNKPWPITANGLTSRGDRGICSICYNRLPGSLNCFFEISISQVSRVAREREIESVEKRSESSSSSHKIRHLIMTRPSLRKQ